MMFAPYCPTHGSRVLLFSENIRAIRVEDHGFEVDYVCNCGYEGTWQPERRRANAAV